jgi:hypothetical protein
VKEPRLHKPSENQPAHATSSDVHANTGALKRTPEEVEEAKLIRRLQMMMNMVMSVIAQDGSLSVDEASQMIADARTAALAMFPGKELAYDLIWRPRFQRLMRERFRLM